MERDARQAGISRMDWELWVGLAVVVAITAFAAWIAVRR
jgi:hypothetical protein